MDMDQHMELHERSRRQIGVQNYTRFAACALMVLCLSGLTACVVPYQMDKSRSEAFKQYETIIRWSQWDAAFNFIAPEYLQAHPVSQLEMDRLRLFRVTQYTIRSTEIADDGMAALQTVEVKMFNSAQATERSILDVQEWRYDPESHRWLLHSGLPDPTRRY